MNRTTKDVHGCLTGTILNSTVQSFILRVISRHILDHRLAVFFYVLRIIIVSDISTRVRFRYTFYCDVILTITTAEQFSNFVSTIDGHFRSRCRCCITTTIHLSDAGTSASINNHLGGIRSVSVVIICCRYVRSLRLIGRQVTTTIHRLYVEGTNNKITICIFRSRCLGILHSCSPAARCCVGNLCCTIFLGTIYVYQHTSKRRTLKVVTSEDATLHHATLLIVSNTLVQVHGDILRHTQKVIHCRTHTTAKHVLFNRTASQIDNNITMVVTILQSSILWICCQCKECTYRSQSSSTIDRALHGTTLDTQVDVTAYHTGSQCSDRTLTSSEHITVEA